MSRVGDGRIFWNDLARGYELTDEKQYGPDYNGSFTIDGKRYLLQGWRAGGIDGAQKYVRISIIDPKEKP